MTKLNDSVNNLLERVGNQFAQATGKIPLKDAEGKDLPTLEGKVEIIDNQLSITVGGITVPIRIIHVFDHNYAFTFNMSTLPRTNLDINSIFKQVIEIFHATKPEILKIVRKDIWYNRITIDIENTDGRCNRKFSKAIKEYIRLRRRIGFVGDLRMVIEKAVTCERLPKAFFLKMKNGDEITLFVPDEFQSTELILTHIDKADTSLQDFEIKISCYDQDDKLITHRRLNKWRPEQW